MRQYMGADEATRKQLLDLVSQIRVGMRTNNAVNTAGIVEVGGTPRVPGQQINFDWLWKNINSIPDTVYPSAQNPTAANSTGSGTSIVIQNNTFRNPSDVDYMVSLIQNSLV